MGLIEVEIFDFNNMKDPQFVCIGGYFVRANEKISNGKKISEQLWVFENLKTKRGCDSYFSGWCN